MAKPLKDELVEHLASSTLLERFSVDSYEGWAISFDKLSDKEFERLVQIALNNLSANTKIGVGDDSQNGHRAVRWLNLTNGEARGFARAVAAAFQAVVK